MVATFASNAWTLTNGAAGITTYSATAPSGATTGDLLFGITYHDNDGVDDTGLTATGWTLVGSSSAGAGPGTPANAAGWAKLWTRTATSASTYTVGGNVNSDKFTVLFKVTGADPTTPVQVNPVWSHPTPANSANMIAPTVTATASGMLVCLWVQLGAASGGTIGVGSSGMTAQSASHASTAPYLVELLASTSVSAGATGTKTVVASAVQGNNAQGYLSMSFVINDAPTTPQAAGVAAGTSTATGTITQRAVVSGVAAGMSTAVGNAVRLTPISGTAAGVSAASGNVIRTPPAVAGTAAGVSGASGAIVTIPGLAGTAAGVSGASGAVRQIAAVSGTAAGVSSASGSITATLKMSGTAAATSTVSGTVTMLARGGISGTAAATSSASGSVIVSGKPSQGSKVLELFDPDEVLTGGRVTIYQFDLLDEDENLIGTLQGVDAGSVTIDAYSSVKGTGTLSVYTDPANADLPDGQPDFLGVQLITQTGIVVDAQGTPIDSSYVIVSDADDVGISIGDQLQIADSTLALKEPTVFTITTTTEGFGFTNLFVTPDFAVVPSAGDQVIMVTTAPEQVVDWLNVRIRPMIRIQRLGGGDDPEGALTPAGVYLCAAPVENWDAQGQRRDVELTDKLSILDQDIASGDPVLITAYSLDTGANMIDAVIALIQETGEKTPAIQPDPTKTLDAPMVWDLGTTRLKIVNDLLDAAGYFSLFADGWGQFQAVPYVQPSDRTPVYESIAPFSNGEGSLMDPAWTRDRDIYSIPNRYFVVGQGDGTTAALTSTATNVDPASPYSFPSRGRWITVVETGIEAADQGSLDTIAKARLSSATSITDQLTVNHIFLPDLHINSVVRFVNPGSMLDTYCYVVNTSIPFDPGKLCQTVMRRVAL